MNPDSTNPIIPSPEDSAARAVLPTANQSRPEQSESPNQLHQPTPPSHQPVPADHLLTPERSAAQETRSFVSSILAWVLIPLGIVIFIHLFIFQPYHVVGSSMVPTLHDTDYLVISKIGATRSLIQRAVGNTTPYIPKPGEIIVFHFPKDPKEVFVKRVIGVPGDRVIVRNGQVLVYRKGSTQPINPDLSYEDNGTLTMIDTDVTVHDGNVFVMGDNRRPSESFDSREWGELPSSYIIGEAVVRLLPLDQIKIL